MDGVGNGPPPVSGWAKVTHSRHSGKSTSLTRCGLLYSAFTQYAGFKVNSGEYKLMGLAPYGTPRYVTRIYEELIDVNRMGPSA